MSEIALIWAESRDGVIGAGGAMPWHVSEDLAHFKGLTWGAPVIMGRRTWESLDARFRPLPGRRNLVVTSTPGWSHPGAERVDSLADAIDRTRGADTVWVIGGGRVFAEAIDRADRLEVTELDVTVDGDVMAPVRVGWHTVALDPPRGWRTSRGGIRYRFRTLLRPPVGDPITTGEPDSLGA